MREERKKSKIVSLLMAIICSLCIFGIVAYNDYETAYAAGTIYVYYKSGYSWSAKTGTGAGGGCGDVFVFTPSRSGIYRFYSTKENGDPYIVISDRAINDYGNADTYNGANASYSWSSVSSAPTYQKIRSLTKYSYEGADNVGYNDDGNGSLNFNLYVYMEAGHQYDVYATRWSTSSQTTFTTYCTYIGTGTITLNNQGATSPGTTKLYGGRAGYSACVSKNRGYRYTTAANGDGYVTNLINIPTRSGYKFNGYYTGVNGAGTRVIDANGKINNAALSNAFSNSGTIYASWTPQLQKYSFYSDSTYLNKDVSVMYGNTMPTLDSSYIPTKAGYTFGGYKDSSSKLVYNANGTSSTVNYAAGGTTNLSAVWTANDYNINFNANGGTGSCIGVAKYDNLVNDGLVPVPTKTGYSFAGYYNGDTKYFGMNSSGILEFLGDDKLWKTPNDITLTAKWTPIKYNIDLYSSDDVYGMLEDAELGERSSGYVTTIENSPYGELELPSEEDLGLVKAHYDFVGWNIYDGQNWAMFQPKTIYRTGLTTDGNTYNPDGSIKEPSVVQIYAAWAPKDSYTIAYNANGGKGAPRNATTFEGETYTIQSSAPIHENYGFIGWYETPHGDDVNDVHYYIYNENPTKPYESSNKALCQIIDITESKTLYARWVKNNSVTYNANGGSFATALDVMYPAKGDTVTVNVNPSEVPTKPGYKFMGWGTAADSSAIYKSGSNTFTMGDSSVVLYAIWEIENYSIIYNPSVADGVVTNNYIICDEETPVGTITNYTGNVDYGNAYTFEVTLDKKICNDTNLQVDVNNVNIPSTKVETNGDTVKYKYSVSNVMSDQVVTVTGLAKKNYFITYVKNGGNYVVNEAVEDEFTYDATEKVALPKMEKTGYTFEGWYTTEACTDSSKCELSGDKYVIPRNQAKNITVYAKYKPVTYTVTYDVDPTTDNSLTSKITGTEPSIDSVDYDKAYEIKAIGDVKLTINGTDIEFLGWNTNPLAVSAEYNAGESVRNLLETQDANITLYAIWNLKQHRISYDLEGGEGSFDSELVYDGTDYTVSTTTIPTKAGHSFDKWVVDDSAYTVSDNKIANVQKDLTLKAEWIPEKYTIIYEADPYNVINTLATADPKYDMDTFKIDGAKVDASNPDIKNVENIKYGQSVTIKDYTNTVTVSYNGIDNTRVIFKGWATSSTATDALYKAGDEVTNLNVAHSITDGGTVTLYGVYDVDSNQKHYIIYDIKDGAWSGAVPSAIEISSDNVTITTEIPKKKGYSFKGWTTDDSDEIAAGSELSNLNSITSNVILRAVYEPENYTIIFDPNDDYTNGVSTDSDDPINQPGSPAMLGPKGVYIPVTVTEEGINVTYRRIGPNYTIGDNTISGGLMNDKSAVYGSDCALDDNKYMSDTYDFMGWSYDKNATVPEFVDKAIVKNLKYNIDKKVTLYAIWEPKKPLVRFNANSGSGGPSPVYDAVDNKVDIPTMLPDREGYTFLGWSENSTATEAEYKLSINADGERSFDKKVPVENITNSLLLYAVWEQKETYKIEYKAFDEGVSAPVDITTYYEDETAAVDILNAPVKAGYHFVAWVDSNGKEYNENDSMLSISRDIAVMDNRVGTITLTEKIEPNEYGVYFYADGKKYNEDAIKLKYDQSVSNNAIAKAAIETIEGMNGVKTSDGYEFKGWSMIEGATEPVELKNLTTIKDAEISLYAIRQAEKINVVIDNDNGAANAIFTVSNVKAEYGKIMPVLNGVSIPEKYGYVFEGYYTAKNGQGTQVYDEVLNAKCTCTSTEDITLYAKWTEQTYRIIYVQEGATLRTDQVSYGANKKMASSAICLDGTVIKGETKLRMWSTTGKLFTDKEGEQEPRLFVPGEIYEAEDLWNDGADLILYPVIGIDEIYSITYNTNGGAGGPVDVNSYEYGDPAIVNTTTRPERDNYDFLGWSKNSGATEPEYVVNGEYTLEMKNNVTLYAVWRLGTYTIHYETNAQDAVLKDGATNSIEVERGVSTVGHLGEIYERKGYELLGWSTSNSSKNSVTYSLNGAIASALTSGDDITLYTVWAPKTYIVSFDTKSNNEAEAEDIVVTYDSSYGTLPSVARAGYTFAGWYDTEDYSNAKVLAKDKYKEEGNQILYAKWIDDEYNIIYYANTNANDSTIFTDRVYVNDNVILRGENFFADNQIVKPGYTLVGFATTRNGAAIYELGQNTGVEWAAKGSNVKLYCVWEANSYKVNFDTRGGAEIESRDYIYGSKYDSLPVPERTGYSFKGWYKDFDASSNSYSGLITAYSVVDITKETTLYAVWDEETLEVVYYPNYDSKQGISVTYSLASDVVLKDESFFEARPGYSLEGYATSARGAIVFDKGQSVGDSFFVAGSSVKLYMVWSANDYTVSFDTIEEANGTFEPITVTYGDTYGPLPTPKREGYLFEGWYAVYNKETKEFADLVTEDTVVKITDNQVLYPKMTAYYVVKQKRVVFQEAAKTKADGKKYKIIISNKKLASMNKKGVVKFKRPGTVKITVIKADKTLEYVIDIKLPIVPKKLSLNTGDLKPLDVQGADGLKITYTSTNPAVATVDENGNITAKSKGKAKIITSINGKDYKTKLKVR